jgi:very-short-patch-repair endonuclease
LTICSVSGCDNNARAKSFCKKHYERFRKHGDPLALRYDLRGAAWRKKISDTRKLRKIKPTSNTLIALQTEECRQKRNKNSQLARADGSVSKKISEAMKLRFSDPEEKRKHGLRAKEYMKAYWARLSPEERSARSKKWTEAGHLASTNISISSIEIAIRNEFVKLGVNFEHQKTIGRYRVDFFLPEINLIVECDGRYWHSRPGTPERDASRDSYYKELGFETIRLTEDEINKNARVAAEKVIGALVGV